MENFAVFTSYLCQNCEVNPSTKNSSQTQHCRSETRRKEEQKMPRNWSCRKNFAACEILAGCTIHPAKFPSCCHYSSYSTVHHFSTIHLSCCFTLLPFCYNFLFHPILSLVIAFDFGSFCNFAWLGQYISSYTIIKDNFCLLIK